MAATHMHLSTKQGNKRHNITLTVSIIQILNYIVEQQIMNPGANLSFKNFPFFGSQETLCQILKQNYNAARS